MLDLPIKHIVAVFGSSNFITSILGNNPTAIITSSLIIAAGIYLAYRFILEPSYTLLVGFYDFWRLKRSDTVLLELTPPKQTEVSSQATQQLFTVIQESLRKHDVMTLEIISTKQGGIRYLVRVRKSDAEVLQRHLASYLPELQFQQVDMQNLYTEGVYRQAFEVKQSKHYAYPLQSHEDASENDAVAYITGAMTKLNAGEMMSLQLVLAPHRSPWTARLRKRLLTKGYIEIENRIGHFLLRRWWVWLIALTYGIITNDLKAALAVAVILVFVSLFMRKPEPTLTPAEKRVYDTVLDKLNQPLFRADIRFYVAADSQPQLQKLSKGITSSLAPLNVPAFQRLSTQRIGQKAIIYKLRHRLPSLFAFSANVLSATELASLYHFPHGTITTEGMVRSHSRTLPAPLAMKNSEFDVVLGENHHHGSVTPIGLTEAERQRHVYIIGGTGNGKTTMIQYSIVQDIQNGKGLAVVDPHGDMAETLLRYIPEERIDDVIYFNPADLSYPIGLNLLELPEDATGDELLLEKDFVTETVVSIFRKIFSDDGSGGHRIEYMLRNSVQTAFTVENATLFTVYELINDPKFRKKVVSKLKDEDLKNFWKNEFGKAGSFQQVKMASGITAKIGRFLRSEVSKRVLEQPKSTINFEEILDGKILICNLSKGMIGEDTSELFGISILAKLQLAALRRARISQDERKPFYLYVDEFQNFATVSFIEMLSEARKYKLFLTMAEQSTSQQDEQRLVNIILANVGTVICFRSGSPADEQLLLPLFSPHISEGEIANLPSYNFYMRVAAVRAQEPFSGETVLLKSALGHGERVIAGSRKRYTTFVKKAQEKVQSSKATTSRENPKRARNTSVRRAKSID